MTTKSKNEERFFYAGTDADVYDKTIEFVVPLYREMHNTITHLVKKHYDTWLRKHGQRRQFFVLDVGCGTGAEAIRLCQAIPHAHVIALDVSTAMQTLLATSVKRSVGRKFPYRERITAVTGSIIGAECASDRLLKHLPVYLRQHGFDLVVSGFAIHHFTHHQKILAYQRIFDVLRRGGVFINGDLFSFQSKELARTALDYDLNWIGEQFNKHTRKGIANITPQKLRTLKKNWLVHYQHHNKPEPLEDRCDSKPGLDGQFTTLLKIGFAQVECPFRFWQVGVVWAKKP